MGMMTPPEEQSSRSRIGTTESTNSADAPPRQTQQSSEVPRTELKPKELKEKLTYHGIDCRAMEKSELLETWNQFEALRKRPLQELQASLAAASVGRSSGLAKPPTTTDACAAQLLGAPASLNAQEVPTPTRAPSLDTPSAPSRAAPWRTGKPPAPTVTTKAQVDSQELDSPCGGISNASSAREQEAAIEVRRIERIRRASYSSASSWGFAVLAVQSHDIASVQRGYRALMKKLHPDKVTHTAQVSKALEAIKEAKDACERCLSRQFAPGVPRKVSYTTECALPGKRRYRLHWTAPLEQECAPVRRYIVAAFDPAYGKALNICILEPDYNEELQRSQLLGEYVLDEEELQKMPTLWQKPFATLQVAAANEAGQSTWATIQVSLTEKAAGSSTPRCPEFIGIGSSMSERDEERAFEDEIRRRFGEDLRIFLERQRKPQLISFVKRRGWSEEGTKGDLVDRVILKLERERGKPR